MRRDSDYFGEQELVLVYMARRLKEALAVEKVFDASGIDYAVETGTYHSGLLFFSERTGAFFYVEPQIGEKARTLMREHGYKPYK